MSSLTRRTPLYWAASSLAAQAGFLTICNTAYDHIAYCNHHMTSYDHIWSYEKKNLKNWINRNLSLELTAELYIIYIYYIYSLDAILLNYYMCFNSIVGHSHTIGLCHPNDHPNDHLAQPAGRGALSLPELSGRSAQLAWLGCDWLSALA